jgi:hypothetical protein
MKSKILILLFLSIFLRSMGESNVTDSLLLHLDMAIKENKTFMQAKEMRLNSLKSLVKNSINKEQAYNIYSQIFNEYRTYNIDSALYYLNLNLQISEALNNKELTNETKCNLSRIFTSSGLYKESMDIIITVDRKHLSNKLRPNYYRCYEFLYNELYRYTQLNVIADKYQSLANLYRDSLLSCMNRNANEYWHFIERLFSDQGKVYLSKRINTRLLLKMEENTPEYAYTTYRMAMIYNQEGNIELYKKYLIISAISDIKSAVKENTSLNLLASQLYKEKDIDRAYKYVKFALEDANFCNARLRMVQVSNILPVISQAYQTKSEYQKAKLRHYLLIISVLTIFLTLAVVLIYKQMRNLSYARNDLQRANKQLMELNNDLINVNQRLNELNNELLETNKIKEQYIGLFLSICSAYIDKLENYRRMANKFITSGKVAELYETTKSKQLIEKELKEFYENFDNTFLNIYPNFVEELNSLLIEEEKIILKKGELLNTELRIFALIRLGINDSSRIASLLRYSVNTIYNYRVKIKNKAIVPRNDFENMVMKIGVFSK